MKVFYDKEKQRVPVKAWIDHVPLEDGALQQLINVSSLPFIHKHVSVMPDAHFGMGATIGSVIATKGAVIPAAVGVDIGCGMSAVQTNLMKSDLPSDLKDLRHCIESAVPHGRTNNGGEGDRGAWHDIPSAIQITWDTLFKKRYKDFSEKHPKGVAKNTFNHLGTLGTGNHFIEVCIATDDKVWIMLHSGSRGMGNRIGTYFINIAKQVMDAYFIELPDPNLAYLIEGSQLCNDYLNAVDIAQKFAYHNRDIMMRSTIMALGKYLDKDIIREEVIDCHHNFITKENHFNENIFVTRKGAVRAREGDMGIIPGSMGERSFIVKGKGNEDSFMSCSHGAGRIMSRTEARKTITLEEHAKATEGVECRKEEDVLDESPKAYKNIDDVMRSQEDLVSIEHELKQVLCVKG